MTWLSLPFSREGVDDSFNASPQRVKIWLAIKASKPGSAMAWGFLPRVEQMGKCMYIVDLVWCKVVKSGWLVD